MNIIGERWDVSAVQVATFPHLKSRTPTNRPLLEVLSRIKGGEVRGQILALRKLLEEGHAAEYNRRKQQLPTFYVSGTAESSVSMLCHSGLLQVDLDKLGSRFRELRQSLTKDPHAFAVFTSPSGEGVKVLLRAARCEDRLSHEQAFAAMIDYIERRYDCRPDAQCKNWNRHCLLSADPGLFLNLAATPLEHGGSSQAEGGEEEDSSSKTSILHDCETIGLPDYATTPRLDAGTGGDDKTLLALRFQRQIEKGSPLLWEQYVRLVERRTDARGGRRNITIVQAVPFLYRALGTSTVRLYMEWFYRVNAHAFHDPIEKHMGEVDAALSGVEASFRSQLSQRERNFWDELAERDRAAFRIARDLALFTSPHAPPPPAFSLSGENLALRLGIMRKSGPPQDEAGARCLRKLVQYNIISEVARGQRRQLGVPGVPTTYRWELPFR